MWNVDVIRTGEGKSPSDTIPKYIGIYRIQLVTKLIKIYFKLKIKTFWYIKVNN